jgi:predicted transglutaminase-like cysteine proteinase
MAGELRLKTRLSACSPAQSVMDRGVGFWKILVWTSLLLAGAVDMVDRLEVFAYSAAPPIYFPAADHVGRVLFVENEVNGATAHHDASATRDEEAVQLFGMDTEPVTAGPLLDKWRRVEAGITKDLAVIAQCQANKPCSAPAQKLIDLSLEGTGRSRRARVGMINRAVNLAISPVSDEMQWGVPDHWSDPLETLQSNSGDCEDYAIVKYVALLVAGFSKDAVKIVVLRNRLPNEDHAVVAVRLDHQWLILDNRTLTLVRDTDVTRAIPEFVLDDQGVSRVLWSSRNRKAIS